MTAGGGIATVLGAAVLGIAVPWTFIRMLSGVLLNRAGSSVPNYRGHPVSPGLGIVWFVWAGCAIVGGVVGLGVSRDTIMPVLALAGPLALVAFAAGLIDDSYGTSDAKGFRGHLGAIVRGRLTTGGLKLVAIGLASLFIAVIVGGIAPWGNGGIGAVGSLAAAARFIAAAIIAGAGISLTSNFVNLTDLRPGRALKTYGVLVVIGVALVALSPAIARSNAQAPAARAVDAVALLAFVLGPVVAVWRDDLGERGMLGDAGANPMGAVAGLFMVTALPMSMLVVYTLLMFALNAASERVSFSRVIESVPVLRWLDGLGRLEIRDGEHPIDVTR